MPKLLRQNVGGIDYNVAGCALTASCSTPAATAAKTAVLTDGDTLADGMSVTVSFTYDSGAASPMTLTVGGVTANICDSRGQNTNGNIWQAGNVVTFLYTHGKFLLLNSAVNEVSLNNMSPVSSDAVASNTIQKINLTTQGADLEANIKAFLDEMSGKPTGVYGGILNSSVSNGNYSLTNIYNENINWRNTIGIIEFDVNYGVYYVFRTSSGSDTPYYIVRRIDLPTISAQNTATKIDARFPSGSYSVCYWWRCGRIVTVRFSASSVLSTFNHLDPCYSGLPKPIYDSIPMIIPQWGGQPMQFTIVIDNDGNLCTNGNASAGTDVVVSGECAFTYITRDD